MLGVMSNWVSPLSPGSATWLQFRIAPSIEYQDRAFEDAKHGRPSRGPVFWGLFPTMADPTLAPPGCHIMSANIFHKFSESPVDNSPDHSLKNR